MRIGGHILAGAALAAFSLAAPVLSAQDAAAQGRTIWEGFHVGGHIGAADTDYDLSTRAGAPALATLNDSGDGVIGGIAYGSSWQFGQLVLGTDSDYSFSDTDSGTSTTGGGLTANVETNWSSSSRVRAGHLITPNLMVYGTVGIALADIGVSGTLVGGSRDDRFFGVQYGGGLETTLHGRYFLRAEYLHTDYDDENFRVAGGGRLNVDPDSDVVRGVIGYRFDWSPFDLLTGR